VLDGQLPREPSDLASADHLAGVAEAPTRERPRSKRVYFEVFGCQMNKLDAELMLGVLAQDGYVLTGDIEDAGVILYNTCAIREQAENRVFSKVSQLKSLKKSRPDTVIGILGCGAQNHQHALFERFPHVGIVCGPGEFLRLPEFIDEARDGRQVAALDLDQPVKFERRANLGPQPHHAYVSVMRGCDMACTYCVVPHTRGAEVSRSVREIVDEARALVDVGVREITLLGQTVNSYGKRLGRGREIGLQHVLHQLDKIAGLERVRFITSHPRFMNPDLIDAMASLPSVCEYLHLPVQSGSDAVLRRMQRSYSMSHYRKVIDACRERIPDLALATDIIVGFCGETDADFQETVDLMEETRFHGAFVFRYSERPRTSAAELVDDVPEEVKRERNQILLELQKQIGLEIHSRSISAEMEVLVEGISKRDKSRWSGRNRQQQIVVFPVQPGDDLVGKLVTVKIAEVTARVLVGARTGEAR
jgi:tRNA-2-methylthio-N6-dimethylallyladenosine synthase